MWKGIPAEGRVLEKSQECESRVCLGNDKQLSLAQEEGERWGGVQWLGKRGTGSQGDLGATGQGMGFILTRGARQ